MADFGPNPRRSSNIDDRRRLSPWGGFLAEVGDTAESLGRTTMAVPEFLYNITTGTKSIPDTSLARSAADFVRQYEGNPQRDVGPMVPGIPEGLPQEAPSFFQRQRALAGNMLFGDPLPEQGGGSPYGGSAVVEQSDRMNNPAQTARAVDEARRGTAPLTAEAVAASLGNAMGILGTGGITTGIKSITELGMGMTPGSLGGFSNIPGHMAYTPEQKKAIAAGTPISHFRAIHAAQRSAARDPSGGAKGHTGERSDRGQAGGGPRGGQQMGGGKRAF